MATTWDPTKKAGDITLAGGNLQAYNSIYSAAVVLATSGVNPNDTQDVSFNVLVEESTASWDVGLCTVNVPVNSRPPQIALTGTSTAVQIIQEGGCYAGGYAAHYLGIGAPVAGDRVELRIKNGKLYSRRKSGSAATAIRGSASIAYGSARTSTTVNKPTGVVAGDTLVAVFLTGNGTGTQVTMTPPAGWSHITGAETHASAVDPWTVATQAFSKIAGGSEPSSYTWTHSSCDTEGGIVAVAGGDGTTPIVASSASVGSGTTASASSITTGRDGTTLIFAATSWDFTSFTTPAGFSDRYNGGGAGIIYIGSKYQATAGASGAVSSTLAGNSPHPTMGVLIGVQPPVGGGGTWLAYGGEDASATYYGSDPANNNGIPLSSFGGVTVYPYLYIENDTFTADFTGWAGSVVFNFTATGNTGQTPILGAPAAGQVGAQGFIATPFVPTGQSILGTPLAWQTVSGDAHSVVSQPRILGNPVVTSATYNLGTPSTVTSQTPVIGTAATSSALGVPNGVVSGFPVLGQPTPSALTTTTWNDAQNIGGWILSANKLSATKSAGGTDWMRATVSQPRNTSVARFFSVTVGPTGDESIWNAGSSTLTIGVCGASDPGNLLPTANAAGVEHTGRVYSASGFTGPYFDVGRPVAGDVFTLTMQNNSLSLVKNGGTPVVVTLTDWTDADAFPFVLATEPHADVIANFSGWSAAAVQATINSVIPGNPKFGAPPLFTLNTLAAQTVVPATPVVTDLIGVSVLSQFFVPVPSWNITDEVGGPLIDEQDFTIDDETRPGTLIGTLVQSQPPVHGSPVASQSQALGFISVGVVSQTRVLGTPLAGQTQAGQPHQVLAQPRILGSPTLISATYVLAVPNGVTSQPRVLGAPAVSTVLRLGVTPGTPVLGSPFILNGTAHVTGTLITSGTPALGNGSITSQVTDLDVPQGVLPQTPSLAAPDIFINVTGVGGATGVTSQTRVLASPAVHQRHVLASVGVVSQTPIVPQASLTAKNSVLGTGLVTQPALVGSAAAHQVNKFAAPTGLVSGNVVHGSPPLKGRYSLPAVTGLTAGTPVLGASTAVNNRNVFTGAVLVTSGAAVIGSASAIHQRHTFATTGLVTGNAIHATPLEHQNHRVDHAALLVAGVPIVPAVALTQVSNAVPVPVSPPAPVIPVLALHQFHMAVAIPEVAGVPVLPTLTLGQRANLSTVGLEAGAPIVPTASWRQYHVLAALGEVADYPAEEKPILTGRHYLTGVGIYTAEGPVWGLVGIDWTGLVGGNDDGMPPTFAGGPQSDTFSGGTSNVGFYGRQRSGGME